ncbi:hypothetical protein CHS0354_000675 [Potamilus streckersoni]|uniref:Uncharacterized protein n=1 Tax=Potamilus streckersoni TaxID=2493646 RepID=A0AAE0W9B8_9BIVA|nr:hypothetical protein CHS0354_000675 [Potamilus streckersoni]
MDNTRVDDMLIRMISPKIKEIEEKFSHQKGLSQEDINTLLLHSQYNHINHLDTKLNEVTADVANLRNEFNGVKLELSEVKSNFDLLRTEFREFKTEMRLEFQEALNRNMRWTIGSFTFIAVNKIMDDTRVDDMLIRMISPKIKEIEEKFSHQKGLSQEDINTLLLHSQYNHINHLDTKLNEVTADVANLRNEFNGVKLELSEVRSNFDLLKSEFNILRSEFREFKTEMRLEFQEALNRNMRWTIGSFTFIAVVFKVLDLIMGK